MDDDVGAVAHGFTVLIVRRRRIILGKTAKKNRRIGARPIPGLRIQTRGTRALCLVEFPKVRATPLLAEGGIPRTYVIDRHGSIVYQRLGFSTDAVGEVDRAIQKVLAQR